jgi:hypothetical protein
MSDETEARAELSAVHGQVVYLQLPATDPVVSARF